MLNKSSLYSALPAKFSQLIRSANGSAYYSPPTTASLQTKRSDTALVVDHYGRIIVLWFVAFLAVLLITGESLIPALLIASVLASLYGRGQRTAATRTAAAKHKAKAVSLCREKINRIITDGHFFSLLCELLSHLSCQNISYQEKRPEGLELATATRNGKPVLVAFFTPVPDSAVVSREIADNLRHMLAEKTPAAAAFFTTAPFSIAALRRLGGERQNIPLSIYDRERIIELCRSAGHPIYPSETLMKKNPLPGEPQRETAAKELSASQSIAVHKRKIKSRLFAAALLSLLAAYMRDGFAIRTVYICFALYNLVMAVFSFAGWRRDVLLQSELLDREMGYTANK